VPIDYSSVGDSAWKMAASNVDAFKSATGGLVDLVDQRKQYKDDLKTGKELAKAMAVLYPEIGNKLDPILAEMDNEEVPLSQRASLGKESANLINAYIRKGESDRNYNLDLAQSNRADRSLDLDAQTTGANLAKAEREGRVFESNWATGQQEKAAEDEILAQTSPLLLERSISIAQAMEGQGQPAPISSQSMIKTLREGTPAAKRRLSEAFTSMLPQKEKPTFNEIPITMPDGTPGKASARYNTEEGTWDIVPVRADPATSSLAGVLPRNLAPYAADFEAAGRKYGVDPKFLAAISMHETANGTSNAFRNKNNAMGISDSKGPTGQASVPASIEAMARSLTRPGGHYEGASTIPEIGGIYAPKGAGNDPRGLNGYWPGKVSEYYAALGGDPKGSVRIQAGASTTRPPIAKSPEEKRLLELQIAEKEAAAKGQGVEAEAKGREANAKQSNSQRVLGVISKYKNPDGSPTAALKDAVGFGEGVGSWMSYMSGGNLGNSPETVANQRELQLDLLETDLLNAAKDLKPVSEDEMKMLLSRRPKTTDSPEVWARYIARAEQIIRNGMGESAASNAPSAADRLRAMIPAQ